MVKSLEEMMAELPADRRQKIEGRAQELIREVEGLQSLRALAGRSQKMMARELGIKQPSVHKMEKQVDVYLSTLKKFVEAAGGTLELRVHLPGHPTIQLTGLGDLAGAKMDAAE